MPIGSPGSSNDSACRDQHGRIWRLRVDELWHHGARTRVACCCGAPPLAIGTKAGSPTGTIYRLFAPRSRALPSGRSAVATIVRKPQQPICTSTSPMVEPERHIMDVEVRALNPSSQTAVVASVSN